MRQKEDNHHTTPAMVTNNQQREKQSLLRTIDCNNNMKNNKKKAYAQSALQQNQTGKSRRKQWQACSGVMPRKRSLRGEGKRTAHNAQNSNVAAAYTVSRMDVEQMAACYRSVWRWLRPRSVLLPTAVEPAQEP